MQVFLKSKKKKIQKIGKKVGKTVRNGWYDHVLLPLMKITRPKYRSKETCVSTNLFLQERFFFSFFSRKLDKHSADHVIKV